MSMLFAEPPLITVQVDPLDQPSTFHYDRADHPVEQVVDSWRVDTEWWAPTGRIWRDYWVLITSTGYLLIIYHDLVKDLWYIQRIYD